MGVRSSENTTYTITVNSVGQGEITSEVTELSVVNTGFNTTAPGCSSAGSQSYTNQVADSPGTGTGLDYTLEVASYSCTC